MRNALSRRSISAIHGCHRLEREALLGRAFRLSWPGARHVPRQACVSRNSWSTCRCTRSVGAWRATRAATRRSRSRTWISFCAWPSRSSPFARVCATSRRVCARISAKLYHAGHPRRRRAQHAGRCQRARDWRIYRDFAACADRARPHALCATSALRVELDADRLCLGLHAPSTCALSLFPWAHFQAAKAAVKLHTLLDLRGNIPCFVHISDGKMHDVNVLDLIGFEPGASTSWTAAIIDFARLLRLASGTAPSSSLAPSQSPVSAGSTRAQSTRPPACAAIRRSC